MTLSVVARDPSTGHLGVALYSGYLAVGRSVPWVQPGVGAVVTQALTSPSYGPQALKSLGDGVGAIDTLGELLANDEHRELRQVAIVDAAGQVAAHTGTRCIPNAGHAVGPGVVALANVADTGNVWAVMLDVFLGNDGELSDCLVSSLRAAEEAGGDARGGRSAALLVASGDIQCPEWDRVADLRVDDSQDPVSELERLLGLHDMYTTMGAGIDAIFTGHLDEALSALRSAGRHPQSNAQTWFWEAVSRTAAGDIEGGKALLERAAEDDPRWLRVWDKLPSIGLALPPSET